MGNLEASFSRKFVEFVAERAAKTKIADLLIAKIFFLNSENSFFCHTLLSEVVLFSLPFWIG